MLAKKMGAFSGNLQFSGGVFYKKMVTEQYPRKRMEYFLRLNVIDNLTAEQ